MFAVRRNLAAAVKCWRHLHYPRWVYVVASTLVKCLMNVLPSMKCPIQTESLQSDRGARERERKTFSKDAAISNRPHNQTPFPQIVRTKKSNTNKRKKNKCRTKPNWNAATQQTNSIQCVPCPLVFCSKCFIRACAQKFKKSEKKNRKETKERKNDAANTQEDTRDEDQNGHAGVLINAHSAQRAQPGRSITHSLHTYNFAHSLVWYLYK